ncbi:MAG: sialidase family protein, partial [Mycobacteriales bacterium]
MPASTQAGEGHLVATARGTIVYQAQNGLGDGQQSAFTQAPVVLGVTKDQGRTWTRSGGNVSEAVTSGTGIDNALYRDPETDRLFWAVYGSGSSGISVALGASDDGGRSWQPGYIPCCAEGENPRMLAAHPRVSRTHGYPDVLYYC